LIEAARYVTPEQAAPMFADQPAQAVNAGFLTTARPTSIGDRRRAERYVRTEQEL
jgi:hypothetical protein